MKIQPFSNLLLQNIQYTQPQTETKTKTSETSTDDDRIKDPKTELRNTILKQLSELEETQNKTGEGDPKAERIIRKFNSGKKLSPEELSYLIKNAPGSVDRILRITAEREQNEMMMRMARTKADTMQVALHAVKVIEKTSQSPEEIQVRTSHLQDSVNEYQKTDDYKEKPNTVLETKKKKKKGIKKATPQSANVLWIAAKKAYLHGIESNKSSTSGNSYRQKDLV